MHDKARRFRRRQQSSVEDHPALRVNQHRMEIVGRLRPRAQLGEINGHADRQAKQADRLIEKMGAKIEPDPAPRAAPLPPAVAYPGTIAVEVRFEIADFPQQPFVNQ